MAFEPAIDIGTAGLEIEFATGSYASENAKIFQSGTFDIGMDGLEIEFSTGPYVSEGSKVFSGNVIDIGMDGIEVEFSGGSYMVPPSAVFTPGTTTIVISALPVHPGDEAIVIVFGIGVDFIGSPRSGKAPLCVQFENLSYGAFEAFEWHFGDGDVSFESAPDHIYLKHRVYDVRLRVRVEGQWYETTKYKYIHVYPGGLVVSRTNKSYALGLLPGEGIGFSENTGEYPFPESGDNALLVYDDDDQPHLLVLDNNDGFIYDIMQRDGPAGTGIEKQWLDKVGTDGTGGTVVVPSVAFAVDVGTFEHYWMKHLLSYVFARSANEAAYRGAAGYDAAGFPTGLELTLKLFVDGERVTEERQIKNLPITGTAHTDADVSGHRIQLEVSANMGAHAIVGIKKEYLATDRLIGDGEMTEDDYQEELSEPVQWFSRGLRDIDRATGMTLSATELAKLTACSGPDGETDSANEFAVAVVFPTVSITNGIIILWHQSLTSVQIGATTVTLAQLTGSSSSGSWQLSYARNVTASGAVTITPTATGKIFDHRIFNSAVSDAAIEYYFNNIVNHYGDVVLP